MNAESIARELGGGAEKQQGADWLTLCPAHNDKNPSLSLRDGDNNTLLWHCRAGCGQAQVMERLKERGLLAGKETAQQTLTVDSLARSKKIPADALRSFGLRDSDSGVIIEYRAIDGQVLAEKQRTSLIAKKGSFWPKGQPLLPYGLDLLNDEPNKPLVMPEGESDCWTLWHHGYRALGIPGAGAFKTLEASHLETVDTIFIIQENDEAGSRFEVGIKTRLRELQYIGKSFTVHLPAKDPNELHKKNPAGFRATFNNALFLAQVEHLARLSTIEYEQSRKAEAKRLGVRPSVLDAEVQKIRTEAETKEDNDGALSLLVDPEPWSKPVCGHELLDKLARIISQHVVLPVGGATAIALWILFTYCHDWMRVSPILCFTSPEKRCGKTTGLSLLRFLVQRPLLASNITPAALFRSVEKWRPSLLIDEADTFVKDNDELRGVLNSGHTRETAFVIRTSGEDHEPQIFSTWSPKAVALIGKLPPTLADRAIHIPMRRKLTTEKVDRLRIDQGEPFADIKRQALRWAADNAGKIMNIDPETPAGLNDRAADNWRGLLAVAELVGGAWPEKARQAVRGLTDDETDDAAGVMLLHDIRMLFTSKDRISSADLVTKLGELEDRPWPEWRQGKPITVRQVARLLNPFGIRPKLIRFGSEPARGYEKNQFKDSFSRYLGDSSVTALQAPIDAGFHDFQSVTQNETVTDRKSSKSLLSDGCNVVTDGEGESEEKTNFEVL